jgi:hypothetical protein
MKGNGAANKDTLGMPKSINTEGFISGEQTKHPSSVNVLMGGMYEKNSGRVSVGIAGFGPIPNLL